MSKTRQTKASSRGGNHLGLFLAVDLGARGIPRGRLSRGMLRRNEIERVGRGLYRLRDAPLTELDTIAAVSRWIRGAIVCLLTALHIHGIRTQARRDLRIALDRKARKPQASGLPVRVARFSGPMLCYAIEPREVIGVPVGLTSPARTVLDCFRYRKKIGLDVALEALGEAANSRRATVDGIIATEGEP